MIDEAWLQEGLRQFRAGMAWRRLAFLSGQGRKKMGEALSGLTDAFLADEWLPGVKDCLDVLRKEWREGEGKLDVGFLQRLEPLFREKFLAAFAQPVAADDPRENLRQLFVGCFDAARKKGSDVPVRAVPR